MDESIWKMSVTARSPDLLRSSLMEGCRSQGLGQLASVPQCQLDNDTEALIWSKAVCSVFIQRIQQNPEDRPGTLDGSLFLAEWRRCSKKSVFYRAVDDHLID